MGEVHTPIGSWTLPREGDVVASVYEVGPRIGVGGTAVVHEATCRRTGRTRALKLLKEDLANDADLVARFLREATITAGIHSEHLVEVLDVGTDAATGAPFVVMELLGGESLASWQKKDAPIEASTVVDVVRQLGAGLSRLHAAGVVHRDVKPDNVRVARRDDGSWRAKIIDFGTAKLIPEHTGPFGDTLIVGTLHYMPPEQLEGTGDVDGRADLYALAHVAFALLVGRPYFTLSPSGHPAFTLLHDASAGVIEPASVRAARAGRRLPRAFDAWFAKATSVDRARRFDDAGEMVDALDRALSDGGRRASGLAPIAALAVCLAALGAIAWVVVGARATPSSLAASAPAAASIAPAEPARALDSTPETTSVAVGAPRSVASASAPSPRHTPRAAPSSSVSRPVAPPPSGVGAVDPLARW